MKRHPLPQGSRLLGPLIAMITALLLVISKTLAKLYRRMESTRTKLKRAEALKAAITESALDCIISMDHEGKVIDFNPAAEAVFGFKKGEAIGREMAQLIIPGNLRDAHRRGLAHYLATGQGPILEKRIEMTAIRADGIEFPVELTVTRIKLNSHPVFTGFIRDITDRKQSEQKLIDAIRARDELVGVVSHELKNPLTAMSTSMELIARTRATDPEGKVLDRMLARMKTSILRMVRITSDLLDITKIEAGRLPIDPSSQEVRTIVTDAIDSLRPVAAEKHISLSAHLSPDAPRVHCDRERIVQVLLNLIGNAIKFSPDGSTIIVKTLPETTNQVRFEVRDQGPGIPPERQSKVFDRFWQAKETAFKGTGLGLPISKGIIEAHGGRIGFKSQVGQGSSFFFILGAEAETSSRLSAVAS